MKNKILYLMHVDWDWIKQRPHFLAENLSDDFDILVAYVYSNRRAHMRNNKTNLFRIPILSLPLSRFKIISFINSVIKFFYFWGLIAIYRPSIVWFTFPTLIPPFGLRFLKNILIVYDCMDDAPEFESGEVGRKYVLNKEMQLLATVGLVLVSSENLKNKLLRRLAFLKTPYLVRNAFGGAINEVNTINVVSINSRNVFKILYVGSISDYLDFDILIYCLNSIENIEFHFFGPLTIDVPSHKRLMFHGVVEHSSLSERVKEYDCFIMPFVLNELIQGVDPVKLYEYINFNKNIICPYYQEIERFSDFVFFYNSKDDFVRVVNELLINNKLKYNSEKRANFLINNSWKIRAKNIVKLINNNLNIKEEYKNK